MPNSKFQISRSHFQAVGEFADVPGRHALAAFQPLGDFNEITDRLAGVDNPLFDAIAADDEHAAGPADGVD